MNPQTKKTYLAHCAISPLFAPAVKRERELAELQRDGGVLVAFEYNQILDGLRSATADLIKTTPDNIAFCKNTTEGLSLVANGYPFAKGDRIVSYIHEYPANHYPWKVQEARGVHLDLLPDRVAHTACKPAGPCAWKMADLEKLVTAQTKIIAISHVQFTSGFAADLKELGLFCKDRNIDLVIDAAQSLGCLPIYPEEWHISAIACSGWKWLLGPVGTGLLYTSQEFRNKLGPVMVGAQSMQQGTDYLDHRWQPHHSAKRFEYSTSPTSLAGALEVCIREFHLQRGIEHIRKHNIQLINLIVAGLDHSIYNPLLFDEEYRSGILAVECKRQKPDDVSRKLMKQGVIATARAGYLRLAPHCYLTEEEIQRAVEICNRIGN